MIDLILLCDIIAVIIAGVIAHKTRSSEAYLLTAFFSTTAYTSFFMFSTDAFVLWPQVFTVMIVIFGLLSLSHVVVIGYVMHLVIVGANSYFEVIGYSFYIYTIFAMQLLAVRYGHHFDYYWDRIFSEAFHANKSHPV